MVASASDAAATESAWRQANRRYMLGQLATIRHAFERHLGSESSAEADDDDADHAKGAGAGLDLDDLDPAEVAAAADDVRRITGSAPPLDQLCEIFRLSEFERNVLLLCAGPQLDNQLASLCARATGSASPYPTFDLAISVFPGSDWTALLPSAPLRRWLLIHVGDETQLTRSPLRLDERILHYLIGFNELAAELAPLVTVVSGPRQLVGSHQQVAQQLAGACAAAVDGIPLIQLLGSDHEAKRWIAADVGARMGMTVCVLGGQALVRALDESKRFASTWERDAVLGGLALLIDCQQLETPDTVPPAVIGFLENVASVVMVAASSRLQLSHRPTITADVDRPTAAEQLELWQALLGSSANQLQQSLEALVGQFSLNATQIEAAYLTAQGQALARSGSDELPSDLAPALWQACRAQARAQLDELAQRIDPRVARADLVLTPDTDLLLSQIAIHIRQRRRVIEDWGFGARSGRGLGISVLFAGPSGTGKTMAAEALAGELQLDLYRIDLSQVVSKYIGETEKNLRRVFDAAEDSAAVLLFDEADALFGKRSEVKDSHDRYANVEVSYLLQRMEQYRGLAILTTNMEEALDQAFLRRLRFILRFGFPSADLRAEIWRRIFPVSVPTEGLDMNRLARLDAAGGTIRNIALNAAFLAADQNQPVHMAHVLQAARFEYAKLKRALPAAETLGWDIV